MFSKCPPSLRSTNGEPVLVSAVNSLIKYKRPRPGDAFCHFVPRGFPAHQPSRTPNTVSKKAKAGEVWKPALELNAAPEIAMAVPNCAPIFGFAEAIRPLNSVLRQR